MKFRVAKHLLITWLRPKLGNATIASQQSFAFE